MLSSGGEGIRKTEDIYDCPLCVRISSLRRKVKSPVYHDGKNTCCDDVGSSTSQRTGPRGDQLNTYTALQVQFTQSSMYHRELDHEETSWTHTPPCRYNSHTVINVSQRTGPRGDQLNTYTALQVQFTHSHQCITENWTMRRPAEHIHRPACTIHTVINVSQRTGPRGDQLNTYTALHVQFTDRVINVSSTTFTDSDTDSELNQTQSHAQWYKVWLTGDAN